MQAGHQLGRRFAEPGRKLLRRLGQEIAGRKQKRGQPRIGVELERRQLHGHAQRMRQNVFAGAELPAGIEFGSEFERLQQRAPRRRRQVARQPIAKVVLAIRAG